MSSSFLVLLSLYSACEHVSVSWGQLAAFIDAVGRRLSKGEETKELTHNLLIWRHIAHYNHVTSVWLFPELSILACVCQEKLVDMSSDSSDRAGKCLACKIYCAWYFLFSICCSYNHACIITWFAVSGWPKTSKMLCRSMSLAMTNFSKNNSNLGLLLRFLTGLQVEF